MIGKDDSQEVFRSSRKGWLGTGQAPLGGNPNRSRMVRRMVGVESALIQTFGRCDPSAALGTGLVKVPRDELVLVLGHSTEQVEYQSECTRVGRHTHLWYTRHGQQYR